jgi:hypothetical protein
MAKKPNRGFERPERACRKAAKKAAHPIAGQGKAEDRDRTATSGAWAGGTTP